MKHSAILMAALGVLSFDLSAQQASKAGSIAAEWYQYRGPKRDGLSPDTGLLKQWPGSGPPLAWKTTGLGDGFSSVAIAGDKIFTMGDVGGSACLLALKAADGKILWAAKVGAPFPNDRDPGPRSTPATDGVLVFGLGKEGELVCVHAATGREVWRRKMSDFGGRMMSGWGYSESPLVDGPLLVVTPGGSRGTVLALNKANGAPVWQSAQLKDSAAYASLVPIEIARIKQYIVFTDKTVAGIAAANGAIVWRADRQGETAVVPTPVYKDGVVFVTSGYNVGCNAFQISGGGGQFRAQEIYNGKQMVNHHGGVVLVGNHVYGTDEGSLKCIELKTGKVAWQDRSVGKGSVTYADGHIIVRGEGGGVALVEATPEGYKEKGRFTPPDRSGKSAWSHPVVFGGRLYLRDQGVLLCYDLKAK